MGPLVIDPGATTDMFCSGENGEVERRVNAMLAAGTVRWSIRDRALTLTGPDGRVTVRATPASAMQILPFHAVPGWSLRIAGAWLADFRLGSSTVTFYDRAGAVITAYPKGPCRQFR